MTSHSETFEGIDNLRISISGFSFYHQSYPVLPRPNPDFLVGDGYNQVGSLVIRVEDLLV
jgi:hypothetical protein